MRWHAVVYFVRDMSIPDPNVPIRFELLADHATKSPIPAREFWNWYLPTTGEPRISQQLKDRFSRRLVSRHPWHYDDGEVHNLRLVFPPVCGFELCCYVSLNSWSISLDIDEVEIGYADEAGGFSTLRLDEVEAIVAQMPRANHCRDAALLLLAPFVAVLPVDTREHEQLREAAKQSLECLGVQPSGLAGRASIPIPDEGCRWAFDENQGLFIDGEWPTSPRRFTDSGFPFAKISKLRRALALPEQPEGVPTYEPPPAPSPTPVPQKARHPLKNKRVTHPKFGRGTVSAVRCDGANEKAVVEFEDGTERTIVARFLKPE